MISSHKLILKIFFYSFSGLVLIAIAAYFLFGTENLNNYISIMTGAAVSFLLFILSILVYRKISHGDITSMLKYLFISFFGKLILLSLLFFIFTRIHFINVRYLLFSFIIFFTIFLNIEVFLIYRKNIFSS